MHCVESNHFPVHIIASIRKKSTNYNYRAIRWQEIFYKNLDLCLQYHIGQVKSEILSQHYCG